MAGYGEDQWETPRERGLSEDDVTSTTDGGVFIEQMAKLFGTFRDVVPALILLEHKVRAVFS